MLLSGPPTTLDSTTDVNTTKNRHQNVVQDTPSLLLCCTYWIPDCTALHCQFWIALTILHCTCLVLATLALHCLDVDPSLLSAGSISPHSRESFNATAQPELTTEHFLQVLLHTA